MAQESLFDTKAQTLTVGQFLDIISELVGAQDFSVQGEVIGAKPHPTGFYFSLKDKEGGGVVDCYMSPYAYRGLGMVVEDGMEVKVGGVPSIYKPKGRFSFRVETLEIAGEGSLKKAYEALKKKLQEEGIFDRKRPLPEFIKSIGLITSKTGAVIDDFRRNLAQLGLRVYLRDVRVEGERAAGQVIQALKDFDRGATAVDVVVLIRGGGSMEDLQAFNNEQVVRAVFGSRVPTIVSIGHDRDVPLAQMTGDASASTPTATAVLINDSWQRLTTLDQTAQRLDYAFSSLLATARADVAGYTQRLATQLARIVGRGRELQGRLTNALDRIGGQLDRARTSIDAAARHLEAASPEHQLRLGYSIVTDTSGAVVRSIDQVKADQVLTTRLGRGSFTSRVQEIDK